MRLSPFVTLLFLILCFFLDSCKPPRCPIKDCQVRMIHRHDGEAYRPTEGGLETVPAFQTDATRIVEEPKGIKGFLKKIFKKKPKAGPDENDLTIEYNANADEKKKDPTTDSLFYTRLIPDGRTPYRPSRIEGERKRLMLPYSNADYTFYRLYVKPSAGPELYMAHPDKKYKGVPWWYHNKHAKVAYDYKPGKRYPGYRRSTDKEWKEYLQKKLKQLADTNKSVKQDTIQVPEVKPAEKPAKSENIFEEPEEPKEKKGGLKDLFKKRKKKKEEPPPATEAQKEGN
jgi:hypothetical protein